MNSDESFDPKLLDQFPLPGERPEGEVEELERIWAAPTGFARITAINNNFIGVWFTGAAFLFFLLAGILALGMRAQLALPFQGVLPQETYNQFFTMHGTIMMFLFAVPIMEAVAMLLLPQMLGVRELPFPRLAAYAFWAYFVGGLCFFASLFFGLAPNGGWFMYPPLTSTTYSPGINADFWLLGIGFIEISAIAGAIEIIVGIMRTRAPGMSLAKMPLYAWGMLIFAAMIIIAFPAVIISSTFLELERAFNWPFFDATRGGDPLLWQHLFWFFGHPEVYIIFLPASALISTMIPALARTRLVGYNLILLAFLATAFISFGVWAHHMFTVGMPELSTGFFSAASMAVSVPAGIQVFAWIATFATGRPRWNTPTLFVIGGLVTFVIGGLTGVMVAMVPFDWQVHDSHFIVAHLHYVLIGGMVFPLFAALYFWIGMTSKRPLSERMGKWIFWLMFAGMQITFLPMHLTGFMGMPRRVYTYLPGRDLEVTNFISTVGAFVFAAGVLLFLIELARNFRFSVGPAAGNVYDAGTMEWLPAGLYSVRSLPVVRSRQPLWDQENLADDVEAGRYLLPNAPTGERESLIVTPLHAWPQYLMRVPTPSWWPLFGAFFTAAAFILATVQAYQVALGCGILAILAIIRWLWETDRPVAPEEVDLGGGIMVPTYVTGRSTHGWWAMATLLVVLLMMFLMTVFAYFYVYGIHPQFFDAPPDLLWLAPVLGLYGGAAALALLARWLLARDTTLWTPPTVLLLAGGALLLGFGADWWSWRAHGLDPELSSQGAIVSALLLLEGVLSFVVALMVLYMAARTSRGLVTRPRNNSFDLVTMFIVYAAAQGAAGALLVRLFPGAL